MKLSLVDDDLTARIIERRLLRHAYQHTTHYRAVMDECRLQPEDVTHVRDLARLPTLDRTTVVATLDARTASAPPRVAITKSTSGTTGQPVVVRYNEESRHWRDATRWRGYGWGGYHIGMRAMCRSVLPSMSTIGRSE